MNYDFDYMKSIALDPFAQHAMRASRSAQREGQTWIAVALAPDVARRIANGAWSEAECCCDPGPDEFPELEAPSASDRSH
jgi:hypothetical protein